MTTNAKLFLAVLCCQWQNGKMTKKNFFFFNFSVMHSGLHTHTSSYIRCHGYRMTGLSANQCQCLLYICMHLYKFQQQSAIRCHHKFLLLKLWVKYVLMHWSIIHTPRSPPLCIFVSENMRASMNVCRSIKKRGAHFLLLCCHYFVVSTISSFLVNSLFSYDTYSNNKIN